MPVLSPHSAATTGRRRPGVLYHVAGMTFSVCLALVLVEIILRFAIPGNVVTNQTDLLYRASNVPGLSYEMQPNKTRTLRLDTGEFVVKTNSYGMRDAEPPPMDEPGVIRIAALGDSFTFGRGVQVEDVFVTRLEHRLQEEVAGARSLDVMNFGVEGYSTRDEAVVLEQKAAAWKPQQIVVGYYLNDPEYLPLQPLHAFFAPFWDLSTFRIGRLALQAKRGYEQRKTGVHEYYGLLHADGLSYWQSVLDAFDRIHIASERLKAPVTIAIFPESPLDAWPQYRYRWIHEKVRHAAEERGFGVIDTIDVLQNYEPEQLRLAKDDHHFTPLAHQLVADALFPRIRGILDDAARERGVLTQLSGDR